MQQNRKTYKINQQTPWFLFWHSLNQDEQRLFRLLQRSHAELGKNVQMFYVGYMSTKREIEEFISEKHGIDLNNLPRDR